MLTSCLLSDILIAEAFLPVLIENLDTSFSPVCNNAVWAIGEIAMNYGTQAVDGSVVTTVTGVRVGPIAQPDPVLPPLQCLLPVAEGRMSPHVDEILPIFIDIINDQNIPKTLRENCG